MIIFVLMIIFLLINMVLLFGHIWLLNNVGAISVNEIIYTLTAPVEGANKDTVWSLVLFLGVIPVLITVLVAVISRVPKWVFHPKLFGRVRKIEWRKIVPRVVFVLTILGLPLQLYLLNEDYNVVGYISLRSQASDFISGHYIDPASASYTFPEQKKNLVYLFVESMENTYFDRKNAGAQDTNLMPYLSRLARENTNFSNTENIGGARQLTAASWTMAAMVSHTAGIGLEVGIGGDNYYDGDFLPGVYSIGEVLKRDGYRNVYMIGSSAIFGGRKAYFTSHGYEIRDYETAVEAGVIENGTDVFWGMGDKLYFEYAKEIITELSKGEQPFVATMLTTDLHFPVGYIDREGCNEDLENFSYYENAIKCEDKKVGAFLEWLKEQDFYEDTVVVVVGDHLTMSSDAVVADVDEGYTRTIYNVIINSAVEKLEDKVTKNRQFTTMDMFPTTLAAMGIKVRGDKLGLGVNLYSGVPTLVEKYGLEYVETELAKSSTFYDEQILHSDETNRFSNRKDEAVTSSSK